jgi:hypothetical protein
MAPELLLGEVEISTQECDICALACTFYEVKYIYFTAAYPEFTLSKIIAGLIPFAEYSHNTTAPMKAFSKSGTIPTLPSKGIDNRAPKTMVKCWDYNPSKRPKASDICHVFAKIGFKDSRPSPPCPDKPRLKSDVTVIDCNLVYQTLQRVGVTVYLLRPTTNSLKIMQTSP